MGTIKFEPGLEHDLPEMLNRLIPPNRDYGHERAWHDGNEQAVIAASDRGSSPSYAASQAWSPPRGLWMGKVAVLSAEQTRCILTAVEGFYGIRFTVVERAVMNRHILLSLMLGLPLWVDSGWTAAIDPEQAKAIAAIEKLGGHVAFDEQHPGKVVNSVDLARSKATDAAMENVSRLTTIEYLDLTGSQVTDDGLLHASGLSKLKSVSLKGTKVTDHGLAHLNKLTNLTTLNLSETAITGEGLAHLPNARKMHYLYAGDSKFNDAGMANLKQYPELDRLFLTKTGITDAGLSNIEGLTGLRCLLLEDTQVSDDGLVHLEGLNKLAYLWLDRTKITGPGLVHLKKLGNLRSLKLGGTTIGSRAIQDLKKALPRCSISVEK